MPLSALGQIDKRIGLAGVFAFGIIVLWNALVGVPRPPVLSDIVKRAEGTPGFRATSEGIDVSDLLAPLLPADLPYSGTDGWIERTLAPVRGSRGAKPVNENMHCDGGVTMQASERRCDVRFVSGPCSYRIRLSLFRDEWGHARRLQARVHPAGC